MERPFLRAVIRSASAIVMISGGAILTSCQGSDYADERLRVRNENVAEVGRMIERREAQGDARLAGAADWFHEELERNTRDTAANAEQLDTRFSQECERWLKRQPVRQGTADRIFWGKPERIENTAISMFY